MNHWKMCGLLLLTLSLVPANAVAQVPRIDDLPTADARAPLPIGGGARWLNYSLLASLMKRPAPPVAKPVKDQADAEVQEVIGVQDRIGSVVKGSFLESMVSPADKADQRRFLAELAKKSYAEGAAITQRVSDESPQEFNSSLPVFNPYTQQPVDPTQAAIEQLRNSARNLDQAAADLEDAGKYSTADRLRATAQRLRREAREFAAAEETPTQEAAIVR
jgi:hypothetical protein